jgi:hypothetical protein
MALDYMAIVSYGVYPTPTPTSTRRAALAVSFGLLNFTLPSPAAVSIIPTIFKIGKSVISFGRGIFRIGK